MTRIRWNESMNMFWDHVDPEKEEQQKKIITETDAKVERIVKLVKRVNSGTKEAKQRKQTEVINLIEDFFKQYQSLSALYEDLKECVKKKYNNDEDNESNSSSNSLGMESAGYYSPGSGARTPNIDQPKVKEIDNLRDHLGERYTNLENKNLPLKTNVLEAKVLTLKLEIEALNCQKSELEQEYKGRHDKFYKGFKEKSGFQVESNVLNKPDECNKFVDDKTEESTDRVHSLSNKMRTLQQKFESLEIASTPDQKNMHALVNKSNPDPKSSLQTTVKKMGEVVDEFRKKSEDSVRILNRRICVAEQLHNETRDWYKKTREQHEQDKKDNELAFHSIKIIMSMVSETLSVSETFGLRFVECGEDFTNRVSKVSCEMNFVKDWVRRKNCDMVKVKGDLDALVVQLDVKEEEMLCSRQKALKLENKLRDLKKIVKENDEAMIVLKEEKREAIRQLCVWIDYHRSRTDFHKKAFFELVARLS